MDFDSLRLFVRAAERLSISAAGRELGIAPAVASARLAKLERSVGAELLHRSTRKVAVSIEGEEFLPFAREMLAQHGAAMAALGHGQPSGSGTIRFAASSTFAQLYIIPILPEFLERNPGISLGLRLSDTAHDLLKGSFDLALRNTVLDDSSLKVRKLADSSELLCAPPEYLKRRAMPRRPEDLEEHDLITFRQVRGDITLVHKVSSEQRSINLTGQRLQLDDGASQRLASLARVGALRRS